MPFKFKMKTVNLKIAEIPEKRRSVLYKCGSVH